MLDVIVTEDVLASVSRVGDWLRDALRPFMTRCEPMADVRGDGLFVSIEWVKDRQSKAPDAAGAVRVVDALKQRGFLTSNAGAYGNVVKLRPPLVFPQQEAEAFVAAYEDVLAHLER